MAFHPGTSGSGASSTTTSPTMPVWRDCNEDFSYGQGISGLWGSTCSNQLLPWPVEWELQLAHKPDPKIFWIRPLKCSPTLPLSEQIRGEKSTQPTCLEVAGPDGGPLLVYRLWGMSDRQLPDPREVGDKKFSNELVNFWREPRPTSHELRHLMMGKLAVEVARL